MDNEECDWIDSRRSLFNWLSKQMLLRDMLLTEFLAYPDIIQPTRKRDFSGLYEELVKLSEGCVIELPKSLWRTDE